MQSIRKSLEKEIKLKVLHLKHKQRINHGSMNAVNLHVALLRPVRECCVEAKVLSRKQPAFKIFSLLFCFVLFFFWFLIMESNELLISNLVYYILRKHFLNHSFRPLLLKKKENWFSHYSVLQWIVATYITRDSLTAVLVGPLEKSMTQPIYAASGPWIGCV